MEQRIREKILSEQDKLIYFAYAYYEELLLAEHIDSEFDFTYSTFNSLLAQDLERIPELKTGNLLILIKAFNKQLSEKAKEVMMQRVRNSGEHFFGGENIRSLRNGFTINLMKSAFNSISQEDAAFIKEKIFSDMNLLRQNDPQAHEIISKAGYIYSFDNFLAAYENGIFTPDKLEILSKLSEENPNILDSINYRIFQDSIFEMGEEFVCRIAKYPNISKKLIMIAENSPELLRVIKSGFQQLDTDNKRKPEILIIQEKIITYAAKMYPQLGKEMSFEQLANMAFREKIDYDRIVPAHEVYTEEEFEKKCDEEYENLSRRSNSSKYIHETFNKKRILLIKKFGMDISDAQAFCNRYMKDIDSVNVDPKVKEYILRMQEVLKLEDESEVDRIYYSPLDKVTPLDLVHYEDVLKESYAQTYVNAFEETDKKLSEDCDTQIIEVDGKPVKRIDLKGKFYLLVHSTDSGFKGDKKLVNNSFLESWKHIEDTERHMSSCCYITEEFLGYVPANENGVLAVFTKSSDEDITLMGPSDINTNILEYTQSSNKCLYMTADNMTHNARKVYCEIPVERRIPDYILIFDDTPPQVLKNSYKAAAEFDIPIIFIDKKEVEKEQIDKLDGLINDFQETKDLNVLSKLISTYETNVAGWLLNRDPNEVDESCTENINNERFREDFELRENSIYTMLETHLEELIQKGDKVTIAKIVQILQKEIEKYNIVDLGNTQISKTKMKFNAQGIIDSIKQRVSELPEIIEDVGTNQINKSIDLARVAGSISNDHEIGKKAVDCMELSPENRLKEVKVDD